MGVGGSYTGSLGQIRLPVTFGTYDNYRTELVDFDIAHISLPYNAILRYPTLAQFMAATHPAYNLMKMPGSKDVLTVVGDTKEALAALKLALKTAATAQPVDADTSGVKEAAPAKKKQLFTQDKAETKQVPVYEDGSSGATFTIGTDLTRTKKRHWSTSTSPGSASLTRPSLGTQLWPSSWRQPIQLTTS